MIYSRFGTALALVSKTENSAGGVLIQATTNGTKDMHEYSVADLKADGGAAEINDAVAKLPMKVFETKNDRRENLIRKFL